MIKTDNFDRVVAYRTYWLYLSDIVFNWHVLQLLDQEDNRRAFGNSGFLVHPAMDNVGQLDQVSAGRGLLSVPHTPTPSPMLVKHAAPPRLQRWGVELGTFLPHLKIGYRKGADNGLADLCPKISTPPSS